jgi:hypothetical protein
VWVMETPLGHSQVSFSPLDTYSHVLPVLQHEAADQIQRAIG